MVIKSNTLDFLFLKDGERGQAGESGEDGITLYTWVKYSQNPYGESMTDDPANAVYIGLAYNKETPVESSDPGDYEWTQIRGNDGTNGTNGIDAYTVILTNESMSFSTDQNRIPLSTQSQTCNVIVMQGITRRNDYTLSFNAPSYITVTQLNKVITLAVSPSNAFDADTASVNVEITIDGITFVKTITVSLAKQGIQGIQGIQGLQGDRGEQGIPGTNGIDGKTTYFHIKYSAKANPTVTSDMVETPSTYIGTYVDYDEFDSSDPAKYTWSRFKGENGEQGIPGVNGVNGQTSYLHIKYSDISRPTTAAEMNDTGGKYIGQYTDFTEQDSSDPTKYTWSKIQGEDGVTIVRTSVQYMATTSREVPDEVDLTDELFNQLVTSDDYILVETHWEDAIPSLNEGEFLWTKTEVEYSDGTIVVSYAVGKIGENGNDGVDGKNTYVHLAYSTSQDGSENFSTTIFAGAKYVGFLVNEKESDSILYTDYSWSLFKGADGVSIEDVKNYYLATNQSSGVTKSTSGWTEAIQNVSSSLPYLWNYEEVFDSNGNILNTSDPMIIGYYGRDGINGINGTDGRSIDNVTEYYAVSASDVNAPTTWFTTMQTTTTTLRFLWNYEVITLSDNTTINTNPRIIGTHGATGERGSDGTSVTILGSYNSLAELTQAHPTGQLGDGYMVGSDLYVWNGTAWQNVGRIKGEDGKDGADGKDGKDGRGIASTAITYQKSTSGTTTPTGTWSTTIPEVNPREFLWTRTVITYTDGTTSVAYSVGMMGANGTDGTNGTNGRDGADGVSVTAISTQYCISTSPETNNRKRIDGTTSTWTNAKPQDVADGEYIWTRYVYTFSNGTTSYSNELYDSVITGAERILDTTNGTIKDSVWDKTFVTVIDKETGQPVYKQIKSAVSENNQDINGLTSRVEDVESVLVSKADGSVVTTLQSDVSTLSQRVDGISTNVSSLQTTVNQKADGSTVTALQNDYSSFKQSSTAFQAEVVSDYAKKSDLPEDLDDFSTVKTLANQTALDFSWFVQGHASSSNLTLTEQGLTLLANNLTIKAPNGSETIISGGKITTESIKSLDNKSWINLSAGTFNYNDKLIWNGTTLTVNGTITAGAGSKFGTWTVASTAIYKTSSTWGNATAGAAYFGDNGLSITDKFTVSAAGALKAKSGLIGPWNINSNGLYKDSDTYIFTSGIRFKSGNVSGTYTNDGIILASSTASTSISAGSISTSYITATSGFVEGNTSLVNKYARLGAANTYSGSQMVNATSGMVGVNYTNISWLGAGIHTASSGRNGVWSLGYGTGSNNSQSGKWLIFRETDGTVKTLNYLGNESYPIVSSSTSGEIITTLRTNGATTFSVRGQWGKSGSNVEWKNITTSASDPKLKKNIKDTEIVAIDLLNKIKLHAFDWKETDEHWDVGFIAPELYDIDKAMAIKPIDDNTAWGVNDFYLLGMTVKAIQELSAQNKELKSKISSLEKLVKGEK